MNTVERRQATQYAREFVPAMVGYAIVLALTITLVDQESDSAWNVVWMLAPVVPAAFVVRAVHRFMARADEYQQRVHLEAMSLAFAAAMLAGMTVGFLQVSWDFRVAGWIIFSVGMMTWAVAAASKSRNS